MLKKVRGRNVTATGGENANFPCSFPCRDSEPKNGRPGAKLIYMDGVLDRGAVAVNPMFKRGYRAPRGTAH